MVHLSPTAVSDVQTLAAYVIFLASYLVFALGKFPGLKIDRASAAIIGAVGMVAFRIVQPADALRFIDFPTLVLLFSMMLIVGNLHLVGFFEWNAEMVLRRLKPSRLLPAVVFTSGVLSAFFVNDIVCLVMVPFVLSITRRLRLAPLPYLLAVATASNIGSVASITGNPQSMLIGSFSGIAYRDFLLHLGPVAAVGLFLDWMVLHWMHMREVAAWGVGERRDPTATARSFAADETSDCGNRSSDRVFCRCTPSDGSGFGRSGVADYPHAGAAKAVRGSGLGSSGVLCRAVFDCGRSAKCRNYREVCGDRRALESPQAGSLHGCGVVAEQYCE